MWGAAHSALYNNPSAGPIWRLGLVDGSDTINEGASVNFTLQLINPQVGAQIVWALYNTTANVTADSNWVQGFTATITAACAAHGLSVTSLTTTSTPKRTYTTDLWIQMLPGSTYKGEIIPIQMTARLNHLDNVSPRSGMVCYPYVPSTATLGDKFRNLGGSLSILDTSKTPTGNPIFTASITALDGVSTAKSTYYPGDGFQMHVSGSNIISGTKVKMYVANAAEHYLSPSFRAALLAAISPPNAPPGITFEQTKYPPPAGQTWYDGYTIVFGDAYVGDTMSFDIIFAEAASDGSTSELDIIATVTQEGTVADFTNTQTPASGSNWNSTSTYNYGDIVTYTPNGMQYVALQGVGANIEPDTRTDYWRPYIPTAMHVSETTFVRPPPARYWEIRATTDGTTITYALNVPVKTAGEQVQLNVVNAPAGFAAALASAAAAANSPATYSGGVFTATAAATNTDANGNYINTSLTWQVPFAGTGKNTLNLSNNVQGTSPTVASPITIGDACVFLTVPTLPASPKFVTGVNLSGGEFAGAVPGVYGTDYRYPSNPELAGGQTAHYAMDYLWALGVRVLRLPVRWARIQQNGINTPLSGEKPAGTAWDHSTAYDIARIDEIIAYWTGLGGIVILDIHSYGAYASGQAVGYDAQVPVQAWINLILLLATRYQGNPGVWLDPMNEPAWSATRCRENMQWLLNSVRAYTSFLGMILIEGCSSSSMSGWVTGGQGAAYADVVDPANNFAYNPHCYFDSTGGGVSGVCLTGADARTSDFIAWCRAAPNRKGFVTEIAGGDPTIAANAACGQVVPAAYREITAASDVMLGWTTWGYGPTWNATYIFLLSPKDYTNSAPAAATQQMQMLIPFITEKF